MQTPEIIDMSLFEIMSRWPPTIGVFLDRRMHCVGCPIAPFHSLVEAAEEHDQQLDELIAAIEARAGPAASHPPA